MSQVVPPRPQPASASLRVTFLVPVHDEVATVRQVLERVVALPLEHELIVIDDGSTDGTADVLAAWCAEHPDTVVLTQPNRGKGAALRAGMRHATGDVVVVQDADLEYDPAHVPELVAPIASGDADVVFGSRLASTDVERVWRTQNRLGNKALSLLTRMLYLHPITDMETGHKAFRRDVLLGMNLREDDFAIEPEITAQVLRRRLRLLEVPVSYQGRTHADGKEIRWRDGAKAVRVLLVNRVRRLD